MDIQTLKSFFLWCTIINVALLVFSTMIIMFEPEWLYQIHSRWFTIPRETFNVILYSWLGLYELFIFVFNVVPLVALLIIGGKKS